MEVVALAAVVTENLVRVKFERMPERNSSTSFDELDGHAEQNLDRALNSPSRL